VKGVRPAWCPSCGAEFTCSSVEVDSNENPLNSNTETITNTNEFPFNNNQFDSVDGNIVTKNNDIQNNCADNNNIDIDQNILPENSANNYCNDNSAVNSIKRYSSVRGWRILFTAVSVQVAALILLPVLIFSTATNIDLGIDNAGFVDTKIIEGDLTQTTSDLPAIFKQSEPEPEPETETQLTNSYDQPEAINHLNPKYNANIANGGNAARNLRNTESNTQNAVSSVSGNSDNYDGRKLINFSFIDQLQQPATRLHGKSNSPNVANTDKSREDFGVGRVIRAGSDSRSNSNSNLNADSNYDSEFVEPNLGKMKSDDGIKSRDDSNLLSNEKSGIATEDNIGGGGVDVVESDGEVDGDEGVEFLTYEIRLKRAREQLQEGGRLSAVSPERSLRLAVQAIKRYRELGQNIPSAAQWILGRAYVMLRWGEALVENISSLENMSISSDGQWLWCRCDDDTVWIWDILRSKKTLGGFKLESGGLRIVKLVFTPDFRFAVGVGVDGLVRVWNMELSDPSRSVVLLGGRVSNPVDAQISPDGRWLVVSGIVGGVGQIGGVGQVVGSGEGVIGEFNGSGAAWLWDLNLVKDWDSFCVGDKLEPVILRGHSKPIRVLQISDDSAWLATGSEDATARIYNLRSTYPGSEQTVLKGHQAGIMSIVFSVKGGWVATGGQDNVVRVWKLSGSKNPPESVVLRGHIGWVSSLAADGSGECLASGSFDKTVRVWKIPAKNITQTTLQEPVIIQTDQGSVRQLLFTRNGKVLVSLGGDFSLKLWGVGDGGELDLGNTLLIRNRLLPITNAAITPDDRCLIFNYVNQKDPVNSGIRLLPLQLNELLKSAEGL
jgi:WD40 repeat protein